MTDQQDDASPRNPPRLLSPEQAFETRMRAHEMEQLAWDGYANAFIRTLFDQARSSRSKDVRAQIAADVARHADAMLRERRKRFKVPE